MDDNDDLSEKHIYSIGYDNIRDKINIENKFNDNFLIEGNFRVCIDITVYVSYEEEYDLDEEFNMIKKTINEEDCVICFENKPNILFTDCLHVCVCADCNKVGNFNKCPICRKKTCKWKNFIFLITKKFNLLNFI